jgi:hypothetical protein
MNTLDYEWQEHSIQSVMNYFKKGFQSKNGDEILGIDYFIDPVKERVIFRLTVSKKVQERKL